MFWGCLRRLGRSCRFFLIYFRSSKIFKIFSISQTKLALKNSNPKLSQFTVFKEISASFISSHLKKIFDFGFEFMKTTESLSQEIFSFLKFFQEIFQTKIFFTSISSNSHGF
jgi:hypothetical protein